MRFGWGSGELGWLAEQPDGGGAKEIEQGGLAKYVDVGEQRRLLLLQQALHQAQRSGARRGMADLMAEVGSDHVRFLLEDGTRRGQVCTDFSLVQSALRMIAVVAMRCRWSRRYGDAC